MTTAGAAEGPPTRNAGRAQAVAWFASVLAWLLGGSGPARLDAELAYRPWHLPGLAPWVAVVVAPMLLVGVAIAMGRPSWSRLSRRAVVGLSFGAVAVGWMVRPRRPGGDFLVFQEALREGAGASWGTSVVPTEPVASAIHHGSARVAMALDPAWLQDGFQLPSVCAGGVGVWWLLWRGGPVFGERAGAALLLWVTGGVAAVWWGDAEVYAWPSTLLLGAAIEVARSERGPVPALLAGAAAGSMHLVALLAAPGLAWLGLRTARATSRGTALLGTLAGAALVATTCGLWWAAGVTPTSLGEWFTAAAGGEAWRAPADAGLGARLDALLLLLPWGLGGLATAVERPRLDAVERVLLGMAMGPAVIALGGRSTLGPGGDWNLWALCIVPLAVLLARRLLLAPGPRWVLPLWVGSGAAVVAPWLAVRAAA